MFNTRGAPSVRFSQNHENWPKRIVGAPPTLKISKHSGKWHAGGATTGSQSYRAVCAAAATQRAHGRYEVRFFKAEI
jgi:hypothetical protein